VSQFDEGGEIMRSSLISGFLGSILFASQAIAAGALAVALPPDVVKGGFSYGYRIGETDRATAEAKALDACHKTKDAVKDPNLRSLCKIIQDFDNQCVAVAMDPASGTPGVGWAIADDLKSAEAQALSRCEQTAGPGRRAACVVDHSGCDHPAK
jgi:hypothetical protein